MKIENTAHNLSAAEALALIRPGESLGADAIKLLFKELALRKWINLEKGQRPPVQGHVIAFLIAFFVASFLSIMFGFFMILPILGLFIFAIVKDPLIKEFSKVVSDNWNFLTYNKPQLLLSMTPLGAGHAQKCLPIAPEKLELAEVILVNIYAALHPVFQNTKVSELKAKLVPTFKNNAEFQIRK
jgi:hypothetical protein